MASVKAQVKAIGEAVKRNQFDDAIEQIHTLLQRDPKNFLAHIFLGFSLEKKNQLDDAEKAYQSAASIQPQATQSWQGLIKLFERQDGRKLAAYKEAVISLGGIYIAADELTKCREMVEKFLDFSKNHGYPKQYVEALGLMVPGSPLYEALEGHVANPAATYETMATILEADEKKRINTLIGERRTRIGARLSDVKNQVKLEVMGKSQLGDIYRQLINWTRDDDLRRLTEEKLLHYCYDLLVATPAGPEKASRRDVVMKLADDMVIIKHPLKFAWDIAIDWKDYKTIAEWDVNILREYCAFFPDSDVYKVITGFLTSSISPFPKEKLQPLGDIAEDDTDSSEEDSDGGAPTSVVPVTDEDRLLMMTDGMATATSLLAYRLMAEYYQHLEEYESTVELMRKAITHLGEERAKSGFAFVNVGDSFSLHLATSLVFYQSPRHHEEAMTLFNTVLAHDPVSTPALIGVGLIYEEEEEYIKAADFLTRALERDSSNLRVRAEAAWVRALGGDYAAAKYELESCLPLLEKKKGAQFNKELLALVQYRLGCCIWNLDSSRAARKDRKGAYSHFLAALRNDLNLAPAYTSLGKYYADYAKDKKRARRCFQKAVELSSSEVEAAERLARSFADDGDWDRVEVVARRVVESGKVKPPPGSKRKGISWPHSALGIALMNKLEYREAIASFQACLRISPEDYHSWVGLGESYYSSGRYMAATKAIVHAQSLEEGSVSDISGDLWFTKYMLANVKRELGEFDEAVTLYKEVHESRPNEEGVILALMQTMVENALDSSTKGFFGTAIQLAQEVIAFAAASDADVSSSFNYWKALGDACSVFSTVRGRIDEFPASSVQKLLQENGVSTRGNIFEDVDKIPSDLGEVESLLPEDGLSGDMTTKCAYATTLCYKIAIDVSAADVHAQAVAFYNLGWAEYRVHCCLPPPRTKKSSRWVRAAIRAFKRAIELEHSNAEFWNALGVVTSRVNPAVSQHAFVRSLHLDERSPAAWTNLASLALLQNDLKLANEAFTRAQSNDPDYPYAWLGQGFVALLYGDAKEARGLFTHAMEISESSAVPVRHQYAASVFDNMITSTDIGIMDMLQPIYALSQAQAMYPRDLAYRHLCTLFQERIQVRNKTVAVLEEVCAQLEAAYETSESPEALGRFALAKVDLARSYLAEKMFDEAVECGDMALGLTSDESEHELSKDQRTKGRLSAHLTVGIALYFKGDISESIAYFESALEESDNDPDAVCLLAQVLWAAGTDESKEKAREVLFGLIETAPDHVESVLLLGVVALLDDDEESLDAVVSELHTLRTSDKVKEAEYSRIGTVLKSIRMMPEERSEEDVLTEVQTDVFLHPYQPHGWNSLAEISGEEYPAEMALKVAIAGIPPRGTLDAGDLAKAYAGTGRAADAQAAIFVAPWQAEGWESLGEAVACLGE
ncbi:related to SKI3 - antiviral protein [Cephalotrichum gorgonifer]|uniref:Related to SKI3 - antiviral protein n=1 Tax=Cephalotrichum gorgonifer TaxID=2041049 RepID=A0AAE8N2G5_9PEZI|nr:related to SKI3 - antiviral protein [Cephalotrichum gorgonifer]